MLFELKSMILANGFRANYEFLTFVNKFVKYTNFPFLISVYMFSFMMGITFYFKLIFPCYTNIILYHKIYRNKILTEEIWIELSSESGIYDNDSDDD